MKGRIFRILQALAVVWIGTSVLIQPGVVFAQAQDAIKMSAEAGFDGYCKANQWFPVYVDLENSGPDINGRIETQVGSNSGSQNTYGVAVDLPESSHKQFTLYLNLDSYLSELTIDLRQGEQTLRSTVVRINCLAQTDLLFGVIAATPSTFNLLNELDPDNGSANVANIEIEALPERSQGLEALNVLFFADVDTGVLTANQTEALAGWVAGGGRLVVAGGAGWQKTAAGLENFLPFEPVDIQSLSNFEALMTFSNSQIALAETQQPIPVAAGELKAGGLVLVEHDNLPLVIRGQYGLGDVFYLTFDPGMEPFRTWDGMPGFYRALFAYQLDQPAWAAGFQNWQTANEAASSLPNIALPSALLVCGFLSIYVIVVGPVNYFALRHFKRRELAWVTIPALVLIFSIITLLIGGISRGRLPVISQANIIQVWPKIGQARLDGLVSIYSPRRTTYQVELSKSSLGRPIISFDMSGSNDLTFLEKDEKLTIPDMRVDIGGVESFAVNGKASVLPIDEQLKIVVSQSGAILQGQVTNQSEQTLEDAVLLYPGGALSLGDFAPGSRQELNIPLSNAQIAGRPQISSYAPYSGLYAPSFSYPYYGYGYTTDTTLQDILGTSNYTDDKKIYQRYTLLNSILSSDYNPMGRGGGIYLCGWSDSAAAEVRLADRVARTNSTNLYLIALTPLISTLGDRLELTPGLFVWEAMQDSASSRSNPYIGTIYANETQNLRFRLGMPITYASIEGLILHLEGTSSSLPIGSLTISLWDFANNQWIEIDDIAWGDSQIPGPERFVGPTGMLQLRIMNPSASTYDFSRSDFTLIVNAER